MGISSCVLGEICGNLFRFPESTRKEGKVSFLSAVSLVLFSISLIRSASHRQRACYTLASSLVRQTQLVRLTRVSVADYTSSLVTRGLETQTHPHGVLFFIFISVKPYSATSNLHFGDLYRPLPTPIFLCDQCERGRGMENRFV